MRRNPPLHKNGYPADGGRNNPLCGSFDQKTTLAFCVGENTHQRRLEAIQGRNCMSQCVSRGPLLSASAFRGRVSHNICRQKPVLLAPRPLLRHLKTAPLQTPPSRYLHSSAPTPITATFKPRVNMKEFPTPPSIESLQSQLSTLGISESLPVFPDSNPTTNPVDIYRCYISETLAPIAGVDVKLIYTSLEWTQSFEKGDLILAVPRLRLKGKKPDEFAKEWAEKVSSRTKIPLTFGWLL